MPQWNLATAEQEVASHADVLRENAWRTRGRLRGRLNKKKKNNNSKNNKKFKPKVKEIKWKKLG